MGLQLSAEQIAALEDRAQGWIAGLQFAALAFLVSDDTSPGVSAPEPPLLARWRLDLSRSATNSALIR